MFADKSRLTVADAAGVVGEAPDGHVRLNGVLYKLPDNFPAEVAKSICMIEVDTTSLASVHVPQFRLEAQLGIKPKVYSQFQNITLRGAWKSSGEANFAVNEFSNVDSMTTLNVANSDVVVSGKEKLSSFKKPAARVVPAVGVGKAKAKAKVGRVGVVKKRPALGPFRSP